MNPSVVSSVEEAILKSTNPFPIDEHETIHANGVTGIWANKTEVLKWRGPIPITEYGINDDPFPEIVRKKPEQQLVYEQEVAVRYLRPPTPPPPGEILIVQQKNIQTPPAPPLIIRQQPPRADTPPPLLIREQPPRAPITVGTKIVTISGKRLPPPQRKVIVERLAPMPAKPQSVLIERWLPFTPQKRKVIYSKPQEPDPIVVKPRNVIIQWEPPKVKIEKVYKDLGVVRANPAEYVAKYGDVLKPADQLPSFVKSIKSDSGIKLAAENEPSTQHELVGDIHALRLIDLEREGLDQYKHYLYPWYGYSSYYNCLTESERTKLLSGLFTTIDKKITGRISVSEGEQILIKLNSSLGKTKSCK